MWEWENYFGVDNLSLLEDPEIFILDMGATTHSTGNSCGVTNMKEAQGSVTKMGNSAHVKSKAIGTLKGTICNKDGKEIGPVTINEVHLLPGHHSTLSVV